MKLQMQSFLDGKQTVLNEVSLDDHVFAVENNQGLVHQVITSFQTRARQGSRATKNRSAVSGGGKKPWRQKGTGRARAGTRTSPIWVGGGHTFAKAPYDYSKAKKLNRKVYRLGIRCILSEHAQAGSLRVVDSLSVTSHKTQDFIKLLNRFGTEQALLISENVETSLFLATRNLPNVVCISPSEIDPLILYQAPVVIATEKALTLISENLS